MSIFNYVSVLFVFALTFRYTFASGCQADNIIRGIEQHTDYGFCSSLLTPTGGNTAALATPTYLTVYPSSKISSACSCINKETATTTTSHSSSSSSSGSTSSSSTTSISSKLSSRSTSSSRTSSSSISSKFSTSTKTSSKPMSSSSSSSSFYSSSSSTSSSLTTSTHSSSSSRSSSTFSSSIISTHSSSTSQSSMFSSSSTGTSSSPTITFTSVVGHAYASQTTCSTLPTPTSSLQMVVIDSNQTAPSFVAAYLSPDGSTAEYLTMLGSNGNTYMFDFSDPTKLGILDANGTSLYIDAAGLHFATPNCSLVIDLDISNFGNQLASQANSSSLQKREILSKRFLETSFGVNVQLTDQCQNPVTDLTPSLSVGPTPCHLIPGPANGDFTWTCQFPGENSGEMMCENSISQWLINGLLGGIPGSVTNWPTVGKLILQGLIKLVGVEALAPLVLAAGIFLGPEVLAALATFGVIAGIGINILSVLEVAAAAYNAISKGGLAQDICLPFHQSEFPFALTLEAGTSSEVLASLSTAPSDIQQSAVINDPNDVTCTTCTNGGTCSTYTNCGGSSSCYCGLSTEGVDFCFQNDFCVNLAECSDSSTCAPGYLCLAGNCCGYNVCSNQAVCTPTSIITRDFLLGIRNESKPLKGGLMNVGWFNGTL